jgi:anaerobic selenocysteine-containing dehydrogenase
MTTLQLALEALEQNSARPDGAVPFSREKLKDSSWAWDRVVKGSHPTNCGYQRSCNFNLYVKDGVVLREEQAANYPPPNDPHAPDANPRGCQQGACYAQRMYDPTRIKYPLKRIGERGEGRWRRVGWDLALTEIADTLIDVLNRDGPQAVIQGSGTRVEIGRAERKLDNDPSTRAPALAGGSGSGFRPTGLPVGLHLNQQRDRIWQN